MEATPHHQAIKIDVKRQSKGRKATLTMGMHFEFVGMAGKGIGMR